MVLQWLIITIVLVLQESASMGATMVLAYHGGLNLWLFNFIWVVATVMDVYIGFLVGRYLKVRSTGITRFSRVAEEWSDRLGKYIGHAGRSLSLILLGLILFPYMAAFITSWLGIGLEETVVLIFIGNLVWYLIAWGAVLGATVFLPNIVTGIALAIILVIILNVIIVRLGRKLLPDSKNGAKQNGR